MEKSYGEKKNGTKFRVSERKKGKKKMIPEKISNFDKRLQK